MAVAGEIAAAAREQLPVTWDALLADPRYGEPAIQRRVDLVKHRLFGSVVDPDVESVTYDPFVVEYAGKLVALSVVPAGADYWAVQKIQDAAGERQQAMWVDRVDKLWMLYRNLLAETRSMLPDVQAILGVTLVAKRSRPKMGVRDGGGSNFLTQNPFVEPGFGREFAEPEGTLLPPPPRVRV